MKYIMGFIALLVTVVMALAVMAGYQPPQPIAGDVVGIQPGTVQFGIRQALESRAGTIIMEQGGKYIFGWGMESGFGFVGVNPSQQAVYNYRMTGNLINFTNAEQFVNYLKTNGWQTVSAAAVPETIKTAVGLNGGQVLTWMASLSRNCLVLLFPAVLLDEQPWVLVSPSS